MLNKYIKLIKLYKNKPIILSFFSYTCVNCPFEMKLLSKIENKYKNKIYLKFICIDSLKDKQKIKNYPDKFNITNSVLIDNNGFSYLSYVPYQATPALIIINTNKKVIFSHVGFNKKKSESFKTKIMNILENILKF